MSKFAVPIDVLEKLRCSLCKEYLSQLPVYTYPDQEGVGCGRCPVLTDQNPIRDVSYETIAKYIAFPCRFKPYGCLENIYPDEMHAHEDSCMYKQHFCPFIPLASCPWQGPLNELLDHYEEYHKELVLYEPKFEFTLTDMEHNYLLCQMENLFVIHMKCDLIENMVWFSVSYLGSRDAARQFRYEVSVGTGDGYDKLGIDDKINICDNSMSLDKDVASHITTDDITHIFGAKTPAFICFIDITSNELNAQNGTNDSNGTSSSKVSTDFVDENILRELECPVCNDYMVPPVHQCVAGHSICGTCRSKLDECPTCRDKIQDTRNFVLESMLRFIKYSCKYQDYGCKIVSTAEKIRHHESNCKFGPYECPLGGFTHCKWRGEISDIINHAKREHEDNVLEVDVITFPFVDDADDYDCFLFRVYNETFRLIFKYESEQFYWSVQIVGSPEDCSKYLYELDIIDNSGSNERMFIRKKCNPPTKYEDAFRNQTQFVTVPKLLLTSFMDGGDLVYKCHIIKS